ncbi:MAG: F0F1 ATP synthase subunit A [Candidatus Hydrogenedentota bacterium]
MIFIFLPAILIAKAGGESHTTTVFVYLSFLEKYLYDHKNVAIISSTWFVMIMLWLFFYYSSRKERLIPNLMQGIAESIVLLFYNFLKEQLDERRATKYCTFIISLGLFIFCGNFLGLVPGFEGTTANWSTTAALAILVFIFYNMCGIIEMGFWKHIGHFFGPKLPWYLKIINLFLFPIELISHLVRPLSLSLRLAGNMTGGHVVIGIFLGLTAIPLIYPIPLMGLEFVAAIVQTFIFVLLTTIYIKLATDHTEGEGH